MKLTTEKLKDLIREELEKEINEADLPKPPNPFGPPKNLDAGPDGGMGVGSSYSKREMFKEIHGILKNTKLGKMAIDAKKISLVGEAAHELMMMLAPADDSGGME